MHARDLMELAAIVSVQGPQLIKSERSVMASSLDDYWTASKCRLDRWSRSLRQFVAETPKADPRHRQARWRSIAGVCEEVLTGEVLTRAWTAVLCLYDRRRGQCEAEPVARSVHIGHLEARHRVLTLLVRGIGVETEGAVKLNHLRRRCERWTDLLVGYLSPLGDVGDFAFDPARARDFADDLAYQKKLRGGRHAWPLLIGSLRAAFRQGIVDASPNADLNAKIASGILACFPPELFDSLGLMRSLWLDRLQSTADDAQGMLDELLAVEASGGSATLISASRSRRLGR